jgi:hypothetical protein
MQQPRSQFVRTPSLAAASTIKSPSHVAIIIKDLLSTETPLFSAIGFRTFCHENLLLLISDSTIREKLVDYVSHAFDVLAMVLPIADTWASSMIKKTRGGRDSVFGGLRQSQHIVNMKRRFSRKIRCRGGDWGAKYEVKDYSFYFAKCRGQI